MISTKLRNVARSLAERADAGTLTIEEFALAIQLLRDLADEMAALERAAVPAEVRQAAPVICQGNVVSIFSRLAPQGAAS